MNSARILYADTKALLDPLLFAWFYERIGEERRKKADRMRFSEGKRESLGAWVLLETLLMEEEILRPDAGAPSIRLGENGKPELSDHPGVFFNLSHSHGRVLCALGSENLGCDVERLRPGTEGIADRFFTEEEQQFIALAQSEKEKTERFFRLWTLKESYLKWTGRGLSLDLRSFSIRITANGIRLLCGSDEQEASFSEWKPEADFCCALCRKTPFEGRLEETSFELLKKQWMERGKTPC